MYQDRHSILETPVRHRESLEEQPAGENVPTQSGSLLDELGITRIPPNPSQGRR